MGGVARRIGRPELTGVFYRAARRAEEDDLAIRAVLASTLRADDVYVDVGSNRGQLLKEAVRVAPRGRHVAFEPIPELAAELAARFPALDRRQLALGARQGTASFCHFTKLDGWSGLVRNPEISDEAGAPEMIEVRVSTLDAELPDLRPVVVKVDVEGAELGVLEGGRSLLERAHPLLIFEHVRPASEIYGASSEQLWDLLAGRGYRIFSATGSGPFERADFARAEAIVNWLGVPTG